MRSADRGEDLAQAVPEALGDAYRWIAARLRGAGLESPELDARLLLVEAAGVSSETLITDADRPIGPPLVRDKLASFVRRRLSREPVSRILGYREFYGRPFGISPATLDPRADTETLGEFVLEIARQDGNLRRPISILDVGTGSGAILLTLLAELPLATGTGTDIAEDALTMAAANAHRLGVAERCQFVLTRSLSGLNGPFDFLVSNPPYIPSADISRLDAEVATYDPLAALDGGTDGLGVYRELLVDPRRVVPDGWIVLEIGQGQQDRVCDLIRNGLDDADSGCYRTRSDLSGIVRCVAARTR